VVDFGDLSGMGPLGARLMNAWLALFHVTPRAEILRRLESMEHGMTLDVLPVRYAFIWRGESTAARSLAV
jgi:S-adenosylmethionine-diacylgycerolhomoserine-N-methlytransferase